MKPILEKEGGNQKYSLELDELKNSIKDLGFDFPISELNHSQQREKIITEVCGMLMGKRNKSI